MAARDSAKPAWFFDFGPAELAEWWNYAACQDHPHADDWFADLKSEVDKIARVKSVCGACPVRRQCLDYAMQHPALEGTWGGVTFAERRAMLRGEVAADPSLCSKGLHSLELHGTQRWRVGVNGNRISGGVRCRACNREDMERIRARKRDGEAA